MKTGMLKAFAIIGVVGLLMAAGVGTVLMTDATAEVADEGDALTEVADAAMYNMTLTIGANVEGLSVPIAGAEVTVWSVNVTEDNDTISVVLTKVATGTSDANGTVELNVPSGDYIVVAEYNGLTAYGQCTVDGDVTDSMTLHNYEACTAMRGPGGHHPPMTNMTA